jgi:hypothetical protein
MRCRRRRYPQGMGSKQFLSRCAAIAFCTTRGEAINSTWPRISRISKTVSHHRVHEPHRVFLVGQVVLNFPFQPVSEPFAWRPSIPPSARAAQGYSIIRSRNSMG